MLENTAYTLNATMFKLLTHSRDLQKVKNELATVIFNKNRVSSYLEVENLLYFNVCIQEILRLHSDVLFRMSCVFFEVNIVYNNKHRDTTYVISSDTFTSMSTYITHINSDVFDNFYEYHSQRWINNLKLSQFFITFSRELRNCIE